MSPDDDIPLLADLIRNGQTTTGPGPDVELLREDSMEEEDLTLDLASHQQLGAGQNPVQPDAPPPTRPTDIDLLTEDSSIQELLVEEEIRLILDKHMEAAYEEILQLLHHKIR